MDVEPDQEEGKVESEVVAKLLASMINCWLWLGDLPDRILDDTTTLIPKEIGATDPARF